MNSCIKGNYNFVLNYADCRTLVYTDISDWMDFDNYQIPRQQAVEVNILNRRAVSIFLDPNKPNKITSFDLGVGSKEERLLIPQGIYTFTVESCGVEYKRCRAVDCEIKCKLDNLIVSSNLDNPSELSHIVELKLKFDQMHLAAEFFNTSAAQKLFGILEKDLSCVSCNC